MNKPERQYIRNMFVPEFVFIEGLVFLSASFLLTCKCNINLFYEISAIKKLHTWSYLLMII
jgi:hypothetical protein